MLDHDNDIHLHEKNEIDKMFFDQQPILKHNLPIETLGGPHVHVKTGRSRVGGPELWILDQWVTGNKGTVFTQVLSLSKR